MDRSKAGKMISEYIVLTLATVGYVLGVYFFKFPNNFSFGGVTGVAVVLGALFHMSASQFTFIINMVLLVVGFVFLGKTFGIKTAYVSILFSVGLNICEKIFPIAAPLTDQPLLELVYAIVIPGVSSAILFNMDASSGGTDIIAMMLKKYTTVDIAQALFIVDLIITTVACFVFDVRTGLFSFMGLIAKSVVIDAVIENINRCKYFTIICDNPEPICEYIARDLMRSSTIFHAEGAYSHHSKTIVLTVMRRSEAVQLRRYVHKVDPTAFVLITNSSEIVGKGFQGN